MRRQVDVGMIINIITLLGMIWAVCSYPAKWDQAVADIQEMKPLVHDDQIKLSAIDAQYRDIKEELRAINRKIGR